MKRLFYLFFVCCVALLGCDDGSKDKKIELLNKELDLIKSEFDALKKDNEESDLKLLEIQNSKVAVPDNNFERALIELGYDDLIDGYVLKSGIKNCKELIIPRKDIFDLTGIEAFTSLTYLDCQVNQLTSLDVSKNTALTVLYCYHNQLTSLDIGNNTALTKLYCYGNNFDCDALKAKYNLK